MCVKPFDADCKKTMQFLNCAKIAIKRECGENGVKSFLAQFSAFFNPSLPVLLFDATKPDCINIVLTAITNETSAVDNDITEVPDLSSDEPEDPEETDEHSGTSYQLAVKKILLVFGFAIIFNNLLA
uniref:Uncharacterized protein n=1 Tax=Ditylenchus dipsaci TaxID=166011 RepID=A0A915DN77_9BILA